jgi:hypothetical protein
MILSKNKSPRETHPTDLVVKPALIGNAVSGLQYSNISLSEKIK